MKEHVAAHIDMQKHIDSHGQPQADKEKKEDEIPLSYLIPRSHESSGNPHLSEYTYLPHHGERHHAVPLVVEHHPVHHDFHGSEHLLHDEAHHSPHYVHHSPVEQGHVMAADGHPIGWFKEAHKEFTPALGPQIHETRRKELYDSHVLGGSVIDAEVRDDKIWDRKMGHSGHVYDIPAGEIKARHQTIHPVHGGPNIETE